MEPIITTGAALVGASAWFLDRILGPSADALGEQLRIFSSERLAAIFSRAEEIAGEELHALPPGFVVQLVRKASFSEDDDNLTEMWARLLANAASGFQTHHAIFVDILSQISGQEAQILRKFAQKKRDFLEEDLDNFPRSFSAHCTEPVKLKSGDISRSNNAMSFAHQVHDFVDTHFVDALMKVVVRFDNPNSHGATLGRDPRALSYLILQRQLLVEPFSYDHQSDQWGEAIVALSGYSITGLGEILLNACEEPPQ